MSMAAEDRCGSLYREDKTELVMQQVMGMVDIADIFQPFVTGVIATKRRDLQDDDLEKAAINEAGFLVRFWLKKLERYRCSGGGVMVPELTEFLLPPDCEIDYDDLFSLEYLNLNDVMDLLGVVGTGEDREKAIIAAINYLVL